MPWRAFTPRDFRWRPWDGTGLEHVSVVPRHEGLVATGVVIGERDGSRYGVRYRFVCDGSWCVRVLSLDTTDGRTLNLLGNGAGRWTDADGRPLDEFDGCIDIDLAGSPVTNSLPIRRLEWKESERRELAMLYVPFDTFLPMRDDQIYTCIRAERRFLYEAADGSFSAELPLDEDGFVIDYEPMFRRVAG